MKNRPSSRTPSGVSLLESVIAVAVIAVAVPLALGAIARAGVVGGSARAETRAPGIVDWCRIELEAARRGESELLPPIAADQAFPAGGEVMALAFDRDGALVGALPGEDYQDGVAELGDEDVFFIASLSGRPDDSGVVITVTVEHPSVRAADRRDTIPFHTILP